MVVAAAPSAVMLQKFCVSVEFDGDPTWVSSFLHFSRPCGCRLDLVVIIVMVRDFVMWVVTVLMLSTDYILDADGEDGEEIYAGDGGPACTGEGLLYLVEGE